MNLASLKKIVDLLVEEGLGEYEFKEIAAGFINFRKKKLEASVGIAQGITALQEWGGKSAKVLAVLNLFESESDRARFCAFLRKEF